MEEIGYRGVLGMGMDLVEVERFAGVLERQGEAFVRRVFTEREREYCGSMRDPAPFYAARFAVKEAVSKAFGTGIGEQMGWLDIEVQRLESGAPVVHLTGPAAELARQRGVREVLVTLSHTATVAGATVLLQ